MQPKKKHCAVFTIQKDESFFLPIWYDYYCRYFDTSDIYILDHDSALSPIVQFLRKQELSKGASIIRIHNEAIFDHEWLRQIVTQFQHFLLSSYDKVLFTEIDEFVLPMPGVGYSDLADYIRSCDLPFVRTWGYNVQHLAGVEPDIVADGHLLKQRQYWQKNKYYNKPLLATEPLEFDGGFHSLVNLHMEDMDCVDQDFLLIHLHNIDAKQFYLRKQKNDAVKWSDCDLLAGKAKHNLPMDLESLSTWCSLTTPDLSWELIPESIRDIF